MNKEYKEKIDRILLNQRAILKYMLKENTGMICLQVALDGTNEIFANEKEGVAC